MIDTLHLRIHDIKKKYPSIFEQFYTTVARGSYQVDAYVKLDDGSDGISGAPFTRSLFFGDTGRYIPVRVSSDITANSWHYSVKCFITHKSLEDAYLDVEFSVPKWLYGTNVFQLLAYPATYDALYYKLLSFIELFCSDVFHCRVERMDIELFRLDLCYNQIFNSPVEAAFYLKAQSDQMKAWASSVGRCFFDYDENGWMIKTEKYGFKCYHKGNEFQKHDFKQLDKAAGQRFGQRRLAYDLSRLVEVSTRMLRYEISFRSTMIHYLTAFSHFDSVMEPTYLVKSSSLWRTMTAADRRLRWLWGSELGSDAKLGSPTRYWCDHQRKAFLQSHLSLPYTELQGRFGPQWFYEYDRYTFEPVTLKLMWDFFWKKVREAQVSRRSSVPEMVARILDFKGGLATDKRNSPGRLSKARGGAHLARLLVPALLSQYHDLRELKPYLPRTTYKSLIRDFKKMGLGLYNEEQELPEPTLDYLLYQQEVGFMVQDWF